MALTNRDSVNVFHGTCLTESLNTAEMHKPVPVHAAWNMSESLGEDNGPVPIETLALKNYRLFRDAIFQQLPPFTVVVGANGSGKSTLFDVFSFLKEALTENVTQAVARRGGFRELVSRGETGPIGITVQFRESGGRLATWLLEIATDDGRPVVHHEVLTCPRDPDGPPRMLIDFSRGRGVAVADNLLDEVDRDERALVLSDPTALAIKGIGQFEEYRVVSEFRSLIENWHISDFHLRDARSSAEAGHAEHLSMRGDNVAQVAQYLYENHRDCFDRVLEVMRQRVPGVDRVEAKATEDGRLVLRFQDSSFKDPFLARYVSDGTIRMFAWLILLYDPRPHPLLAIEAPETHLYPELLHDLVEEFRDYARRGGQVFASTCSPEFLNGTQLDEIFWLVKQDGFSTVRRASDSALLQNLVREGDLPGTLWNHGMFEGAGLRGSAFVSLPETGGALITHTLPPKGTITPWPSRTRTASEKPSTS